MASLKVTKHDPFRRGETVAFEYTFSPPSAGFDWSTVTLNAALTAETAPNDNSSAVAVRTNEVLTVDSSNVASYLFQLTPAESKNLIPGTTYHDACELLQGTSYVAKPVVGQVTIAQDYII